jgi:hypothetical protein
MLNGLMLVFEPVATWDRLARKRPGVGYVLSVLVLPLLLLAALVEGYGLTRWGKFVGEVPRLKKWTLQETLLFQGGQLLLLLFFLVVSVKLINSLAATSPWVPWGIGMALTIAVLYHGVPRMMDPDPAHAFGLYLMSCLVLVLSTGLFRFLTSWYLAGKFGELNINLFGP